MTVHECFVEGTGAIQFSLTKHFCFLHDVIIPSICMRSRAAFKIVERYRQSYTSLSGIDRSFSFEDMWCSTKRLSGWGYTWTVLNSQSVADSSSLWHVNVKFLKFCSWSLWQMLWYSSGGSVSRLSGCDIVEIVPPWMSRRDWRVGRWEEDEHQRNTRRVNSGKSWQNNLLWIRTETAFWEHTVRRLTGYT